MIELGKIQDKRIDNEGAMRMLTSALKIRIFDLTIFNCLKKYEQSLRYFTEALDILKQALASNDLSVALSLSSVSIILVRKGQYAQSYDLCSKALRTRHASLGSNYLDVLYTLYIIGNILDEWGKLDQAMNFIQRR